MSNYFFIDDAQADICYEKTDVSNNLFMKSVPFHTRMNYAFDDGLIKPKKYHLYMKFAKINIQFEDPPKGWNKNDQMIRFYGKVISRGNDLYFSFIAGLKDIGDGIADFYVEDMTDQCSDKVNFFIKDNNFKFAIMCFNFFHLVQIEAIKNHKKILKQKKYEKHQLEKGEPVEYKPIKFENGVEYKKCINEETKKYIRHCDAWGVRGHYRRYKSGKIVFIKPHVKGKGIIKNTDYKL